MGVLSLVNVRNGVLKLLIMNATKGVLTLAHGDAYHRKMHDIRVFTLLINKENGSASLSIKRRWKCSHC